MRILKQLALMVLILFFVARAGHATIRVMQKKISVSRVLAGHVLVRGTDAPARGVTVELCSSDWKTVLTSTKTDGEGRFSLEKPVSGKLFYIRVSAPGMDIYELRVHINKRATNDMTIRLSIAT